jgi:hypothetical protein
MNLRPEPHKNGAVWLDKPQPDEELQETHYGIRVKE